MRCPRLVAANAGRRGRERFGQTRLDSAAGIDLVLERNLFFLHGHIEWAGVTDLHCQRAHDGPFLCEEGRWALHPVGEYRPPPRPISVELGHPIRVRRTDDIYDRRSTTLPFITMKCPCPQGSCGGTDPYGRRPHPRPRLDGMGGLLPWRPAARESPPGGIPAEAPVSTCIDQRDHRRGSLTIKRPARRGDSAVPQCPCEAQMGDVVRYFARGRCSSPALRSLMVLIGPLRGREVHYRAQLPAYGPFSPVAYG